MMSRSTVLALSGLLLAVAATAALLAWGQTAAEHTEAAGGAPEMHLALPGGGCTGTPGAVPPNLKCTRFTSANGGPGPNFHIQVLGSAANIGGFQSETYLGGLLYGQKVCSVEVTMTPETLCLGPTVGFGLGGNVSHGNATGLLPPLPAWTNPPSLVDMPNIRCPAIGQFRVTVTVYDVQLNVLGSLFADTAGISVAVKARGNETLDLDGPGFFPPTLVPVADTVLVNCQIPPTPTPATGTPPATNTATPTATPSSPGMVKSFEGATLFLERQGTKIPPANCLAGSDLAVLTQTLSTAITGVDKSGDPRSLGGFSFSVKYDQAKICVEIVPGPAALNQGMQCVVQDARTAPTLQGVASIYCVTAGKHVFPPSSGDSLLAYVAVRPQPEVYSLVKPNNGNGQVTQLLNVACKLTDRQGDPIAPPAGETACNDGDVTMRYLEGDVQPDCRVDGLDSQAIAFRWGAAKGSLLYNDRFNLEPSAPQFDNDIDVNDLQFVYGRLGSTCANPQEVATPVNPKA